jgi:DNA-directed RNA polymerase subunit RPC12/RpoP
MEAATITIVCPECGKEIQAPASFAGKKVRCKGCGHVFGARPATPPGAVARSSAPKPQPAPKAVTNSPPKPVADDDDEGDGNPYGVNDTDTSARCPECANLMESDDAIICLHCGYNTVTRERLVSKKIHDTTGMDWFLHLAPGVACVLAVLFLIIFDVVYCVAIQPLKDDWVTGLFGAKGTKMWVCIGSIFFMFLAGKFAVKRLILHPIPPEIERYK